MRTMGLDVGTKYIGVALSDETGVIAGAEETINRTSDAAVIARIKELNEKYDIKEIVVGLPLNMDGSWGERAKDSVSLGEKIEEETGLSVKLWDERLSTKEAESIMLEADISRAKRKKAVDKLAAQIILQSYLDSLTV